MSAVRIEPQPYSLHVVIKARPNRGDAFEALIRAHIDNMAREDCFLEFVLHRNPADPDRFMFFELWSDRDRYVAIRGKNYFRDYVAARAALIVEPIERAEWDVLRVERAATAVQGV